MKLWNRALHKQRRQARTIGGGNTKTQGCIFLTLAEHLEKQMHLQCTGLDQAFGGCPGNEAFRHSAKIDPLLRSSLRIKIDLRLLLHLRSLNKTLGRSM